MESAFLIFDATCLASCAVNVTTPVASLKNASSNQILGFRFKPETSAPYDAPLCNDWYVVWNTIPNCAAAICFPNSESASTAYVIVFGLKE